MTKIPKVKVEEIQALRKVGKSVPEISRIVGVSKTSVLRYVKNIEILPEFLNEWAGKRGGSKKRKLLKERSIREEIRKTLDSDLTFREKLLFLAALYWAEGNKKDFILTNTDPILIRIFIEGLREIFHIDDDRIQISIRLYENIDRSKSLQFWSNLTKIPVEKFVNVHILVGKKSRKLEYGMCRVRVIKGGDLLKKVTTINLLVAGNLVP